MAESLGSDLESDASSADGGPTSMAWSQTTTTGREQLSKRVDSLQQENRVLKMELDTFRYKCKSLEEENRELKKARVTIVRDLVCRINRAAANELFSTRVLVVLEYSLIPEVL